VAASTGDLILVGRRSGKLQQFGKRRGSGVMQGRTHRHLDGFQIQAAALAAPLEDHAQQLV
jgi:hypothetical protein